MTLLAVVLSFIVLAILMEVLHIRRKRHHEQITANMQKALLEHISNTPPQLQHHYHKVEHHHHHHYVPEGTSPIKVDKDPYKGIRHSAKVSMRPVTSPHAPPPTEDPVGPPPSFFGAPGFAGIPGVDYAGNLLAGDAGISLTSESSSTLQIEPQFEGFKGGDTAGGGATSTWDPPSVPDTPTYDPGPSFDSGPSFNTGSSFDPNS